MRSITESLKETLTFYANEDLLEENFVRLSEYGGNTKVSIGVTRGKARAYPNGAKPVPVKIAREQRFLNGVGMTTLGSTAKLRRVAKDNNHEYSNFHPGRL